MLGPRFARMGGTDEVIELTETESTARLTYRTLPGHAERGEQTFELATDGGRLRFRVSSESVTAHRLLAAFGTAARLGQQYMAMRYVGAMRRLLVRGPAAARPRWTSRGASDEGGWARVGTGLTSRHRVDESRVRAVSAARRPGGRWRAPRSWGRPVRSPPRPPVR
ncbi:DUF1990 family protein [Georgenia deserti]|uniref:DUF1990 family protein n=1 Tax=Georgenia deserti TaxID=2093781 RepID=A0ABW4L208_9MICO